MNVMLDTNLSATKNSCEASNFAFQSDAQTGEADQIAKQVAFSQFIEQSYYEVSADWSQFWAYSQGRLSTTFAELIKYCEDIGKEELVICNIAPVSNVGERDVAVVIAAQEAIVALVYDAVTKLGKSEPESRLNLHRGKYDIRFYLGDQKPTDFSPTEESAVC